MRTQERPLDPFSQVLADANRRDRTTSITRLPDNLLRVPSVKQRTDFSCGAAAALALLRYWRSDIFETVDEAALYGPMETTRLRGTEPQPIAAYLNTIAGISAEYRHGDVTVADLERAIDAKQPAIVDLQAWSDQDAPWPDVWDAGHYVIMVGYDDERLFFMDPSTMTPGPYSYLPREELGERWHDLAGEQDEPVARMAIFVHGSTTPQAADAPPPESLSRLG